MGEPAEQEKFEGVEVEIGGKTFLVTKQMAEALKEEESKKSPPPPFKAEEEQEKPRVVAEDFYKDPEKYIEEQITQRLKDTESKWEKKTEEEKRAEQFWNGFYKSNPDLKKSDDFVKYVTQKNLATLNPIHDQEGPEKVQEKIAELVREQLIVSPPKEDEPIPVVEGAPDFTLPGPAPKQEKVETMGDILRKRRLERRNRSKLKTTPDGGK